MKNTKPLTKFALTSAASLIAMTMATVPALAQDSAVEFDIEAQPLAKALLEFNEQSGVLVMAPQSLVNGKTAPAIRGEMAPEEALSKILSDTGLKSQPTSSGGYTITLASVEATEPAPAPFRVAQLDQEEAVREVERREDEAEMRQDLIVVTGTNIRGLAPESSPTRTFDREDIQISGAATAQDFIQTLPQNFSGGSNVNTAGGLPNNVDAGFNTGFGASVNLRGLGSGSTLVLLNGHRLAPTSGLGDFVDISMIPASAIDRVDVLTDGASSIYGADAVAGVVNFVLRDDFEGIEASYRFGTVTEGDLEEHRTSIAGGKTWNSGNALVAYEYYSQDNLGVEDRSFSRSAATPRDLLPSQERHSILTTVSQEILPDLKFFADFNYSSRDASQNFFSTGDSFRREASTTALNVTTGLTWRVSESWIVDVSGTHSDSDQDFENFGAATLAGAINSKMTSADAKTSGALFSLPGGEVKLALGGHFRSEDFTNYNLTSDIVSREADRDVYAAFGEAFIPIVGADNTLPGVERLELSVSGRFSDFSDFGSTVNPKVGILWSPVQALRFRGSYSTSFNPPPLGRVGASDLEALAYPTALINALFGFTAADPSIVDVVGLGVSGTADQLDAEKSRTFSGGVDYEKEWGRHSVNATATYFDIKFEDRLGRTPIPDNRSNFEVPNIAFTSPSELPPGTIIFNPSSNQINDTLASLDRPVISFASADPQDAAFIIFAGVTRNLSLTFVRGVDFDLSYTYDSDAGEFQLGLDGTYLDDFQQQGAVTTPLVELLNTQFNPTDLRMRGRAGYAHGGITANVFVNYSDSYRVDGTQGAEPIDAWTTVDLSLSYDTRESLRNPLLENSLFRLSVRNIFDQNPPLTPIIPSISELGYDPANASPLNRFVTFEVTKRF